MPDTFSPIERYRLRNTLGEVLQDMERMTGLIEFVVAWPLRALPADVAAARDLLHAGRDLLIRRAENLRAVLDDPDISPARMAALAAEARELARVDENLGARLAAAGKAIESLAATIPPAPPTGGLAS